MVEIIKETSFIYRICVSYNPVMLILANILLCVTFRKKSLYYEKDSHSALGISPRCVERFIKIFRLNASIVVRSDLV